MRTIRQRSFCVQCGRARRRDWTFCHGCDALFSKPGKNLYPNYLGLLKPTPSNVNKWLLDAMPSDLALIVMSFFTFTEQRGLCGVCRQWHQIAALAIRACKTITLSLQHFLGAGAHDPRREDPELYAVSAYPIPIDFQERSLASYSPGADKVVFLRDDDHKRFQLPSELQAPISQERAMLLWQRVLTFSLVEVWDFHIAFDLQANMLRQLVDEAPPLRYLTFCTLEDTSEMVTRHRDVLIDVIDTFRKTLRTFVPEYIGWNMGMATVCLQGLAAIQELSLAIDTANGPSLKWDHLLRTLVSNSPLMSYFAICIKTLDYNVITVSGIQLTRAWKHLKSITIYVIAGDKITRFTRAAEEDEWKLVQSGLDEQSAQLFLDALNQKNPAGQDEIDPDETESDYDDNDNDEIEEVEDVDD